MYNCFFVSDLHGNIEKYNRLFELILNKKPDIVFIGGDIFPIGGGYSNILQKGINNFANDFLIKKFKELKNKLGSAYPTVFIIMGNDDVKIDETFLMEGEKENLWHYINEKQKLLGDYNVFGYSYVPPTPFQLKDWEKYDVSRYVDPGCTSPEEGSRTVEVEPAVRKFSTIKGDLDRIANGQNLEKSIFLFHSPPYNTALDRADLDGKMIDHVDIDVHVGSIAIRRFIRSHRPLLTLHGHIHESTRITGKWQEKIFNTFCFNAAHDGPELSVIIFDPENLDKAERLLL